MMTTTFTNDVTASVPRLTAYARRLAKNRSQAEDLVQETVLRALTHADQFSTGTNIVAWLTTILRNCYFNNIRQTRRFTSIDAIEGLPIAAIDCPQEARIRLNEFNVRFVSLPAQQREALMLVAVEGFSYESAAEKAGCAVGTMKSRVSRARAELERLMTMDHKPLAANQADLDHLGKVA